MYTLYAGGSAHEPEDGHRSRIALWSQLSPSTICGVLEFGSVAETNSMTNEEGKEFISCTLQGCSPSEGNREEI